MRLRFAYMLAAFALFGNSLTTLAAAPESETAEARGYDDRVAFEAWIGSLGGDQRRGAEFWAQERSKPRPKSCPDAALSFQLDFLAGCQEAQQRLALPDIRRKTETSYKLGWNAPLATTQPQSQSPLLKDGPAAAMPSSQRPSPSQHEPTALAAEPPMLDNRTYTAADLEHCGPDMRMYEYFRRFKETGVSENELTGIVIDGHFGVDSNDYAHAIVLLRIAYRHGDEGRAAVGARVAEECFHPTR